LNDNEIAHYYIAFTAIKMFYSAKITSLLFIFKMFSYRKKYNWGKEFLLER